MSDPDYFDVLEIDAGGETVVQVVGEIDMGAQRRLLEVLAQASAASGPLVVDLSRTSFIDSVGLKALLDAWRSRLAAGQDMLLRDRHRPSRALSKSPA